MCLGLPVARTFWKVEHVTLLKSLVKPVLLPWLWTCICFCSKKYRFNHTYNARMLICWKKVYMNFLPLLKKKRLGIALLRGFKNTNSTLLNANMLISGNKVFYIEISSHPYSGICFVVYQNIPGFIIFISDVYSASFINDKYSWTWYYFWKNNYFLLFAQL